MKTEAQKRARDTYDKKNFAYQTVKVRKDLLEAFRGACTARGDRVNTILREAMEKYVRESGSTAPEMGAGAEPVGPAQDLKQED